MLNQFTENANLIKACPAALIVFSSFDAQCFISKVLLLPVILESNISHIDKIHIVDVI